MNADLADLGKSLRKRELCQGRPAEIARTHREDIEFFRHQFLTVRLQLIYATADSTRPVFSMPVTSLTMESVRQIRTEARDSLAAAHRTTPHCPPIDRSPEASSNSRYLRYFLPGPFRSLPCGGPQMECGYPLSLCRLHKKWALNCWLGSSTHIAGLNELAGRGILRRSR